MDEPTIVSALKKRKELSSSSTEDKTQALLAMILEQVTKVADYFSKDEDSDQEAEPVVTQESHVP